MNERQLRNEFQILQEEETLVTDLIKNYLDAINRLKIEHLTLQSQAMSNVASLQSTPLSSRPASVDPQMMNQSESEPFVSGQQISMNELHINETALNLDSNSLVYRMLNSSAAQEVDEDEFGAN